MSPLRILHWYPNFLGGGGVASAVLGLASAQANLGVQVSVATAVENGQSLYDAMDEPPGIHLMKWQPSWVIQLPGFRLRFIPPDLARRLRQFRPDVVHVHGEFVPDNLWVPRIFRSANAPIILSPHGAFHPEVLHKSRRSLKRLYLQVARRLLHNHVARFHAVSPMEREHIALAVPAARVYCVPQGPNPRTQRTTMVEPREKDDGAVHFVFVGRLDVYTKGLDLMVEAFAKTVNCLPGRSLSLTLVGPDWRGGLGWLEQRTRELGIAERVFFTGALPGQQVSARLHEADVYLQLSRHEGYSLSSAEALLAGRPAILSRTMGLVSYPEVASWPHVYLVPPSIREAAAAMVDVVQRLPEFRRWSGEYQASVRSFFAWDRCAKLHLEAYRSTEVCLQ